MSDTDINDSDDPRKKFRPFGRFLIWLSGSDARMLGQCPAWERRKYEAFGASVLVPVCFGMIASSYAVSTLTSNIYVIAGFALVWGFIILTIDRALLSTYRAFASVGKKFLQFILRITVAVLMGLTVSHPLTLLLFRDTIASEVERHRDEEMMVARTKTEAEKKALDTKILEASENLAQLQRNYQEAMSGNFVNEAPVTQPVTQETSNQFDDLDRQINQYREERNQLNEDLAQWQQTYDDEISGRRSGTPGIGPAARAIERDHLEWRRAEIMRLNGVINDLTSRRTKLSSALMEKNAAMNAEIEERRKQIEKQKLDFFKTKQPELLARMETQIASATENLEQLRQEREQLSIDTQERVASLKVEKRADIMVQTLVLHEIFKKPDGGGLFALSVYIILAGLFTLIDTIPLVVKFFSVPGAYDVRIHFREDTERDYTLNIIDENREKGKNAAFLVEPDEGFLSKLNALERMNINLDRYLAACRDQEINFAAQGVDPGRHAPGHAPPGQLLPSPQSAIDPYPHPGPHPAPAQRALPPGGQHPVTHEPVPAALPHEHQAPQPHPGTQPPPGYQTPNPIPQPRPHGGNGITPGEVINPIPDLPDSSPAPIPSAPATAPAMDSAPAAAAARFPAVQNPSVTKPIPEEEIGDIELPDPESLMGTVIEKNDSGDSQTDKNQGSLGDGVKPYHDEERRNVIHAEESFVSGESNGGYVVPESETATNERGPAQPGLASDGGFLAENPAAAQHPLLSEPLAAPPAQYDPNPSPAQPAHAARGPQFQEPEPPAHYTRQPLPAVQEAAKRVLSNPGTGSTRGQVGGRGDSAKVVRPQDARQPVPAAEQPKRKFESLRQPPSTDENLKHVEPAARAAGGKVRTKMPPNGASQVNPVNLDSLSAESIRSEMGEVGPDGVNPIAEGVRRQMQQGQK